MTEMFVKFEMKPWAFHPTQQVRPVDARAFIGALVLAPIMVGVLGFWVLTIPLFAIVYGAPFYLCAATPVYLWALSYLKPTVVNFALIGLALNLAGCLVFLVFGDDLFGGNGPMGLGVTYFGLGAVFAPLWSAAFIKLYNRFKRY